MTVHRIVLVTAAAALLLAIGQSIAQAPPARAEQRATTEGDSKSKMDRVLKLLEARATSRPRTNSTMAAIEAARDRAKMELSAKVQSETFLGQATPSTCKRQQQRIGDCRADRKI